tara:strand:- start:431 stop:553 length:123 start_codon:yes stop_codon:yes gene_type:complete
MMEKEKDKSKSIVQFFIIEGNEDAIFCLSKQKNDELNLVQ